MKRGIDSLQKGFRSRAGIGKSLFHDEYGVTSIEYALLASLIAMVVLVGIVALGGSVSEMWNGVSSAVTGAIKS